MDLPIKVVRKTWSPLQSLPDVLRHGMDEIRHGEKMFYKLLRKATDNKNRTYYVELFLIENDVVRKHRLLHPVKKIRR